MLYSVAVLCLWVGLVAGQMAGPGPDPDPEAEGPDTPAAPECGYGCMNAAECSWVGYGSEYRCQCREGFTGQFCETMIMNCQYDGCHYGMCQEYAGSHVCVCQEGYIGQLCEILVMNCGYGCGINGKCQEYAGSYFCVCDEGYTGQLCENYIPPCESCLPDAQCDSPPCECQGYCPMAEPDPEVQTVISQIMCFACEGEEGSDCHINPRHSDNRQCAEGCQTAQYKYDDYSKYVRGCVEEDSEDYCWDGCSSMPAGQDGMQCKACCYYEYCNTYDPVSGGALIGLSTLTASLACLMAVVFA